MLVIDSLRQLAHLFGCQVHRKNVQAQVVVEAGHAFASVWLIQVAGYNHGIASGFGGPFVRRGGNKRDLFAVRRPSDILAAAWQGTIGAFHLFNERGDLGAVRARYEQSVLLSDAALERQPLPIGRPARIAGHVLVAAYRNGFVGGQVHDPKLWSRPARAVVQNHGVSDAMAVRRENSVADKAKARKVAAG